MRLGDIRLYSLEIYLGENLIFDDISENLPNHLKECIVLAIEFMNGKLKIEI